MMRNSVLFALALSVIFSSFLDGARAEDSSSGCGLGWQVSQKQSLLSSAIRSTTNAVLPNTFSMTSGTSGCAQHSIVKNESEQQYFVEANLEPLTLEMARGQGDALHGLASVMGCEGAYLDFSTSVQKNYSKIFSGSHTPSQILNGVKKEIQISPSLALACGSTT